MTISKNKKIRIWTKENIDQQRYNRLLWETIQFSVAKIMFSDCSFVSLTFRYLRPGIVSVVAGRMR